MIYPNGLQESFTYDTAGNRALRRYGNLEETYQYDQRNRLMEKISFDPLKPGRKQLTTYLYDMQGNTLKEQMKVVTDIGKGDRSVEHFSNIERSGNVDYSRNEEASRQEYLLQNKTYEYDGFNKATKVTAEYYGTAAESTSAYHTATVEDFSYAAEQNSSIKVRVQENFYDAEHLRYGIVEDGERTNFVTNGWNVLSESDAEFDVTKRLVLGFEIVSSNTLSDGGEDYQFFHWNEHGDTEHITGDDGNVLNRYEYDAFGSLTTAEEIIRNRYTYNGEQYDNITSQYYLRARFYNPLIARFTQEDVYRGDGLNLYAYCANNAVMYVDPSGYKCETGTKSYEEIQYKKRLDQTPVDGERGSWKGERGESMYVPNDSKMKALLNQYGLEGINYKNGEVDFSGLSQGTVKISSMMGGEDGRPTNFKLAYAELSKQTGISIKDLESYAKKNSLTWHECNDMKTMQLVPKSVNKYFGHTGGVGEINLYFQLLEGNLNIY